MKKNILFLLAIAVIGIGLIGCSGEDEKNETEAKVDSHHEEHSTNELDIKDIDNDDVIAHIGGTEMNGEDLLYEMKRLELIYALSGDNMEASPNVAIQEYTRNQIIHQLAMEQNITINKEDQEKRALAVKEDVTSNDAYAHVLEGIDEEEFWERETERYEIILESEALINLLMEQGKVDNPDYTEQALRFEAQEDLDEWIQEKITEMDIHIEEIVG